MFNFLESSRKSSHAMFVPEHCTVMLGNSFKHSTECYNHDVMTHKELF